MNLKGNTQWRLLIFFKKEKKLLTNEQQKSYRNAKISYVCKENLKINMPKVKVIVKLGTIVIIQGTIEVLQIAFVI